jgi:hypothetical protein
MYCFMKLVLKVKLYYKIILVRIWKIQDPMFGQENVYPDWMLSKFYLVPPGKFCVGSSNCAETARSNILFNSLEPFARVFFMDVSFWTRLWLRDYVVSRTSDPPFVS